MTYSNMLFAGFHLNKYRHLQDLANALEYWLAGGRDEKSKEMKRLTQLQAGSIADIAYRMDGSPLLTEIITPLLHVPRDGGRKAPPELLAAGKDLEDYATPGAWHPTSAAYQDVLLAWKNRWPVQQYGYLHPRHKEWAEANTRRLKFELEQQKKKREHREKYPYGIESDYSDSDEEQQPRKNKRKNNPTATLAPRNTARSSRSASLSRPTQSNHTAEAERPNKKRRTNTLPKTVAKASTILLPPLVLAFPTQPTGPISNDSEGRFKFLPPLISNRLQPPIRRSSSGLEQSSTSHFSMPSDQSLPQASPAHGIGVTSGFRNTFDQPLHPQNRKYSRLSQVVNSDDMAPEMERPQGSVRTPASVEEERRIRQEQQLALIMTYDLPRKTLPNGQAPGNITAPQADSEKENAAQGAQVAEFVFKDPTKHAPRKSRLDTPLDDGTIDFSSAIVGTQDNSKLSLDFDTTRPDPKNPGSTILGARVMNRYHMTVDFNDKDAVRKLNTWRKQIVSRNFPQKKTKSACAWLVKEKQLAMAMMKEHMDQYGYIKWNHLTNTYNKQMKGAGVVQQAGEELVAQGKRKAALLKEDRTAPWRTKSALAGLKDRWPEFREMVEAARPSVADDESGEIDEGEIVDAGDEDEEIMEPGAA